MKELEDWDWDKHTIRRETGLVEHACPHGVGHPNPGSALWMEEATGQGTWEVHGCDGCCGHPSFPDYRDSLVFAHRIIRRQSDIIDQLEKM